MKFIRIIASRTIILYLLGFLVCHVILFKDNGLKKIRYAVLNRLRPESFEYIVDTLGNHNTFEKKQLATYLFYYKKVIEYVGVRADVYGMIGFCEYHLGMHKNAISSYKKAIEINPRFFWFYYNLGIIYLRNADYQNAITTFKNAMRMIPQDTLDFIHSSIRIYMPIVYLNAKNFNISVPVQLKTGYRDCQRLLILSQHFLNKKIDSTDAKFILENKKINLQIF